MEFILLLILIALLVGSIPIWPYNRDWSTKPAGVLVVLLIVLLFLALTGTVDF